MDKLKYIKLENEDGSYSDSIPLSVSAEYIDIAPTEGVSDLANYISKNTVDVNNLKTQTKNNTLAITGLSSGSPKGTYTTVSALINANPETGVYIIINDGHIYSWIKNSNEPIDLGVYQSTSLADNSVYFNHLSTLLKKTDYKLIHAEDILWIKGWSVFLGHYSENANGISSIPFLLPKGNHISMNEGFQGRITYYDLEFNLIGHTGMYKNIADWSYSEDCYCTISFVRIEDPASSSVLDATNENFIFTGLILKEYEKNFTSFNFTQGNNYYLSDVIHVKKGTEISLVTNLLTVNGVNQDGPFYLLVQEEGTQISYNDKDAYSLTGKYIVQNDGNIRIWIKMFKDFSLDAYQNLLNTIVRIEKNDYNSKISGLYGYIGGNGKIYAKNSNGALLVSWDNDFLLYNANQQYCSITMEQLSEIFPDNIIIEDDRTYISIPRYNGLFYNLNTKTFLILGVTGLSYLYGNHCVPLIINTFGNFCGGLMLSLYNKVNVINHSKQIEDNSLLLSNTFNSAPFDDNNYDWWNIVSNLNKEFNNKTKNIDSYLFFTDPHSMGKGGEYKQESLNNYFNRLQKIYNSIPVEFIVSGGDWLNNTDTKDQASAKLGYLSKFMESKFNNYYPVLGNHDTNYQGSNSGTLTDDAQINLMFNKFKEKYYSFKGNNNMNYVLDTGIDWDNVMNTYRWTQINWLAEKLLNDNPNHAVVFMHIFWVNTSYGLGSMADPVTQLLNAFNQHTSITLNDISYDFSECTGHVDYILSGHLHMDYNDVVNNILCIATTNFSRSTGTYDVVINDYDNHKVYLKRVGQGIDREFDI